MGETDKSKVRREREGWFEKYAPPTSQGIDIGCQYDPLYEHYRKWDLIFGDGDATYMEGVEDNTYDVCYASHIIEHLDDPVTGLKNWYRIVKPGGHLIVVAPHRDLYEKKTELPSNWNCDHKTFWLPETGEPPVTKGLRETISQAIPAGEIVSLRILDEGWASRGPDEHSAGEYSIEAVILKPL